MKLSLLFLVISVVSASQFPEPPHALSFAQGMLAAQAGNGPLQANIASQFYLAGLNQLSLQPCTVCTAGKVVEATCTVYSDTVCGDGSGGRLKEVKFDVGNTNRNTQDGWQPIGENDGGRWGNRDFTAADKGISFALNGKQTYIRGAYNTITSGPFQNLDNMLRSSLLCNSQCTITGTLSGFMPNSDVEITSYHHDSSVTVDNFVLQYDGEQSETIQENNNQKRNPDPPAMHQGTHKADSNGIVKFTMTKDGGNHVNINGLVAKGVVAPDATNTVRSCEGQNLEISCLDPAKKIKVKTANYGRLSNEYCQNGNFNGNTNCKSSSSMTKTTQTCDGKNSCTISGSNGVFGDPCGGIHKYLEVSYDCE